MRPKIDTQLEAALTAARANPNLNATEHVARAAATAASTAAINAHVDREVEQHKAAIVAADEARVRHVEAAAAVAETARRQTADALLRDAYALGAENLLGLVDAFRREPSRALAVAIRKRWDELDSRALVELGAPLTLNVLAAAIIDSIAGDPGMRAAINTLSQSDYGSPGAVRDALYAFSKAQSPAELEVALGAVETGMLIASKRMRDAVPDREAAQRHELRHKAATDRDLTLAREQFEHAVEAARREEFARTQHRAPDTLSTIIRRQFGIEPDAA